MRFNPEKNGRRSARLSKHDYREPGRYFVTICAKNRHCIFGEVANGRMVLDECGRIADEEWRRTALLRENVQLDAFMIMPNHLHGIVMITQSTDVDEICRTMARNVPTQTRAFGHPVANSLSSIIGAFKSATTRRINQMWETPGKAVWQPRFHDHVISGDRDLKRIRQYIAANPSRWPYDEYHPDYELLYRQGVDAESF